MFGPSRAGNADLVSMVFTDEFLEAVRVWDGNSSHPPRSHPAGCTGIRVFKHSLPENLLTKSHPVMPLVWGTPLIVFGLLRGLGSGGTGGEVTLGLFATGVLAWTLVEYLLHRHVFHRVPTGPRGKLLFFMIHGYHHRFPRDRMRLVAPPFMLVPIALALGGLCHLFFGAEGWAQVLAGIAAGYVAYDLIHYYTHHARPTHRAGKWLRRNHMRHHFQDRDSRFGISSPLWDLLLGTFQPPRSRTGQ